jgi:adenine-specific DNA-methyltransferase
MIRKQRLELDWVGKHEIKKLEPRILLRDDELSYGESSQNTIIHGDNLLALKSLEQEFSNKFRCIYIDPPYNTGSAFPQYDDGVEHSLWLTLMRDRLVQLYGLLAVDGSIWISIDDNEAHYLKVLLDEIFGRENFVATIIWQKNYTLKNSAKYFSDMHDYIIVYAKDKINWKRNLLPRSAETDSGYSNPDNDPRGPWTTNAVQARNYYSQGSYKIKSPKGKTFEPPKGTYWRVSQENFEKLDKDNRIWWGKNGTAIPRIKKFLSEAKSGVVPSTMWFHEVAGTNGEAKQEVRELFKDSEEELFLTPKPEKLIKQILEIATDEGDWVLDSFAGSGTTGAVAHKMNRKWVMVENGQHARTLVYPRMKKVVNGEDQNAVSKLLEWTGGGGFNFLDLAPTLITKDGRGFDIINPKYDPTMLTMAVCKHEGFRFHPDESAYWKQGYSTEKDFIFVTTQMLTSEHLDRIKEKMQPDETLLICAKSFRVNQDKYDNITIKKIPNMLLGRCEFGREDYSLPIKEEQQEMDL